MRVAVPTENGQIFQHFGQSKEFTIYDVEIEEVTFKEVVSAQGAEYSALVDFLAVHCVHVLMCGNIGSGAKNGLREKRIELIPGVVGNADEMMVKYLSGEEMGNLETECSHHGHEHFHTCGENGSH